MGSVSLQVVDLISLTFQFYIGGHKEIKELLERQVGVVVISCAYQFCNLGSSPGFCMWSEIYRYKYEGFSPGTLVFLLLQILFSRQDLSCRAIKVYSLVSVRKNRHPLSHYILFIYDKARVKIRCCLLYFVTWRIYP